MLADDSHSDFAPQRKTPPADAPTSIQERIAADLAKYPLVVYMKGVPAAPQCGFSNRVVQIMQAEGVKDFKAFNVLADQELREGIKEYSAWPTIPQVYIGGEFQGGSDVLLEMYESGELTKALKAANVPLAEA
ncbi:glutaredoxin-related protein [Pavlovales sp. CCMP2436]|nr:glutaredoxin-related protein [Pavlovales sp. CCMP2436]